MNRGPACPECEQGKHGNCTGWALDAEDRDVECACERWDHQPGYMTEGGQG